VVQESLTPGRLLATRLANQRITSLDAGDTAGVVAHLGAVQAQEYAQSLWALGLRVGGATVTTIEDAIATGAILRTWPMRGTIHFVASADARWMTSLLAARKLRQMTNVYRKIGLTESVFGRAGDIVRAALAGGNRMQRRELYALLTQHGIDCSASPHGSRGGHVLGYLAMLGEICLGPLDGRQPTFVLLGEWAAAPRTPAEPLAELALRYFSSHGPATAKDFSWWSGLTLTEVRQAIDLAGPGLAAVEIEGQRYWRGADAEATPEPPAGAFLLPAFDEYTVAYSDRAAVLAGRDMPRADVVKGDLLNPLMILDGLAVGVWRPAAGRTSMTITLAPFEGVSADEVSRFDEPCARYAKFTGLEVQVARGDYRQVRRQRRQ
jgi:Winged helix DNA-binding domain